MEDGGYKFCWFEFILGVFVLGDGSVPVSEFAFLDRWLSTLEVLATDSFSLSDLLALLEYWFCGPSSDSISFYSFLLILFNFSDIFWCVSELTRFSMMEHL